MTTPARTSGSNTAEEGASEGLSSWMVFQIAAQIRRARTRHEPYRKSERNLDRLGLTRFDVGN